MRNLKSLCLALSLLLLAGFAHAYNEPTVTGYLNKSEKAQAAGRDEVQTVVLKWVRYASADANAPSLNSGDAVVYNQLSDDGVTVSTTKTSCDVFAGIVAQTIQTSDNTTGTLARDDLGHRNWGWIIVHGKAVASTAAGGTGGHSAGDPFFTSKDEGKIAGWEAPVNAAGYRLGYNTTEAMKKVTKAGGWFLDDDAGGTSIEVFIQAE